MRIKILKAELLELHPTTNDPYDADAKLAAAQLNDKNIVSMEIIQSVELLIWASKNGRLTDIKTAAENLGHAANSESLAFISLLEREIASLDLNKPKHMTMIDDMVTETVLSAGDRSTLTTLSEKNISRATELNLGRVRPGDVIHARNHV